MTTVGDVCFSWMLQFVNSWHLGFLVWNLRWRSPVSAETYRWMDATACSSTSSVWWLTVQLCQTLHITAETQCPEFKLLKDLKRLMLPNSHTFDDCLPHEIWHLWHLIVCACYCIILWQLSSHSHIRYNFRCITCLLHYIMHYKFYTI